MGNTYVLTLESFSQTSPGSYSKYPYMLLSKVSKLFWIIFSPCQFYEMAANSIDSDDSIVIFLDLILRILQLKMKTMCQIVIQTQI